MPTVPPIHHYRSIATLIPLSVIAVALSWRLFFTNRRQRMTIRTGLLATHRHPVYWFDDGSVIVRASDDQLGGQETPNTMLFRIHESLLRRHVKCTLERQSEDGWDVPTITLPPAPGVLIEDFTALLAFLYHDAPLSVSAPFPHVAALLRVSAPEQLDIPSVHTLARACFVDMFPSGPRPFVHPAHLEEALCLAVQHDITSIQRGIYYSLVTTTDFEGSAVEVQGDDANPSAKTKTRLTSVDIERCRSLLNGIIAHFTPVLFEPPVVPHIVCSNLLGEKWFTLVTQSAIAGDGVYKPLEALEQLKQIDWTAEGLCKACAQEKMEDWTREQDEVWDKMDGWLELGFSVCSAPVAGSGLGSGSELRK